MLKIFSNYDPAIINWNMSRGLLETFNPKLEIKMLSEEVKEFYLATEVSHRLCEFCDFHFVLVGAKTKADCMQYDTAEHFVSFQQYKQILLGWANEAESNMFEVLKSLYHNDYDGYRDNDLVVDLQKAMEAVIECNNKKSVVGEDGKVIKIPNQPKPMELIDGKIFGCKGRLMCSSLLRN